MKKLKIDIEKLKDEDIDLIKKIKNSHFTNDHRYKQCYFEPDKIIPNNYNCCLPCDLYCPNRIKN